MDYTQKHERIAKIISQTRLENLMESLSSIEYNLHQPIKVSKSVVPLEANFQFPEMFLKTLNSFEVEKIFGKSDHKDNWNVNLNEMIDFLDNIEFSGEVENEPLEYDEKTLQTLIKNRN